LKVGESMKFTGVHGGGNYSYTVANASVGSIAPDGVFTASAKGDTTVAVKDASGSSASSLQIHVVDGSSSTPNPPPDNGGPGMPGGDCPLGDQQMCDIICQMKPDLPFCK
jgi:thermitase